MIKIFFFFFHYSFVVLEIQILVESQQINICRKDGINHVAISTQALRCLHSSGWQKQSMTWRQRQDRQSQSTFWISDTSLSSSRQPGSRQTHILANIPFTTNTARSSRPGISVCSFTGVTINTFIVFLSLKSRTWHIQIFSCQHDCVLFYTAYGIEREWWVLNSSLFL